MALCSVKAQGQLYLYIIAINTAIETNFKLWMKIVFS